MILTTIIITLLTLFAPQPEPSVPELLSAIVETGHGRELFWYTPRVAVQSIKGAPTGWKGAPNCRPVPFSGVVYINPTLPEDERLDTVIHELVHLANDCHGTEHDTELATLDVMAFLVQEGVIDGNQLKRFISRQVEGCYDPASYRTAAVTQEYYCRPLMTMVSGDMTKYRHLSDFLASFGVR